MKYRVDVKAPHSFVIEADDEDQAMLDAIESVEQATEIEVVQIELCVNGCEDPVYRGGICRHCWDSESLNARSEL